MEKSNSHLLVILTGLVVGAAAIILAAFGNPGNMGFCIACFIRDIAGGVKMHTAPVVQYVRPEIIGIVLGSMVMALIGGEFKAKGGSAPVSRFVLGFFVMVGALMFLGCPLRMVIRLGGGDGNALFGLLGFVLGVWVGTIFLGKGFTFKRAYNMPTLEGYALPAINVVLLVLLLMGAGVAAANAAAAKAAADAGTEAPEMAKTLLAFSLKGPGSMHAPIYIALIAGLVVGALAQKSRLCMAGGIRDAIMLKDLHLLWGFIAIFAAVLVGNFIRGKFAWGFDGQPVAFNTLVSGNFLWAVLGMFLDGFASILLGGCPLRQLVLAGAGSSEAVMAVLGMTIGAAVCHNFGFASSRRHRRYCRHAGDCSGQLQESGRLSVRHYTGEKSMNSVDARGYACPQPVIMTKKALEKHGTPLKVLVDDKAPVENITRFASNAGHKVSHKDLGDGEYELTIE